MDSNLLVSFVIPVYNPGEWLEPCLASILVQSEPNLEIIVVNDGSTHWPSAPSLNDSRVALLTTANRGVSAARNYGFAHAKGKYIAFQDADDMIQPDFVKSLVQPLEQDEALLGAYCDGELKWMYETPQSINKEMIFGPIPDMFEFLCQRPMSMWCMILRRDRCQHLAFDTTISSASEDWDYLLNLAKGQNWAYVPQKLFIYRQTQGSMTRRFDRLYLLTDSMLLRHYRSDGIGHLTKGQLKSARHHLKNWVVREIRAQRTFQHSPEFKSRVRKLLLTRPELWFWHIVRKFRP